MPVYKYTYVVIRNPSKSHKPLPSRRDSGTQPSRALLFKSVCASHNSLWSTSCINKGAINHVMIVFQSIKTSLVMKTGMSPSTI